MSKTRKNKSTKVYLIVFLAIIIMLPIYPSMYAKIADNFIPFTKNVLQKIAITAVIINNPQPSIEILKEKYNFYDKEYPLNEKKSEISSSQNDIIKNNISEQLKQKSTRPSLKPKLNIDSNSKTNEKSEYNKTTDIKSTSIPKTPPVIEEKYRGKIIQTHYVGNSSPSFVNINGGYIRNYTKLPAKKIQAITSQKPNLKLNKTNEPQVLIFHTHATESFEEYDNEYYDIRGSWRSTDNNRNMVAVGDVLEEELKKSGICVIHDKTQHDYPSYNGSYSRSAKTVKEYLKEYPSIKIVMDLHRDAVEKDDNVIVKSVATIDGEKSTQVMVVAGCDDGTMNIPNWQENLKLGAELTRTLEKDYNGLTRPIFLCYAKYNTDLSDGMLLLEFGTHANTVDEAKLAAKCVGKSMGKMLLNYME